MILASRGGRGLNSPRLPRRHLCIHPVPHPADKVGINNCTSLSTSRRLWLKQAISFLEEDMFDKSYKEAAFWHPYGVLESRANCDPKTTACATPGSSSRFRPRPHK